MRSTNTNLLGEIALGYGPLESLASDSLAYWLDNIHNPHYWCYCVVAQLPYFVEITTLRPLHAPLFFLTGLDMSNPWCSVFYLKHVLVPPVSPFEIMEGPYLDFGNFKRIEDVHGDRVGALIRKTRSNDESASWLT